MCIAVYVFALVSTQMETTVFYHILLFVSPCWRVRVYYLLVATTRAPIFKNLNTLVAVSSDTSGAQEVGNTRRRGANVRRLAKKYTFRRASRFHVPFPVLWYQRIDVNVYVLSPFFFSGTSEMKSRVVFCEG